MNDILAAELRVFEEKCLLRSLRTVASAQGREIVCDGRQVLNFCSNDYLGLAADVRIVEAAKQVMGLHGFGSGSSRLVCGNMDEHAALEAEIATLKKTEAALLFSTGYMANVGIISALVGRDDVIFSDRLNHASILDGIVLSRAEMKRYPHNDMVALEQMLAAETKARRKLIVTDSVFSMDGDVARLPELAALAKRYHAWLMVDEAHAFGLFGASGAGMAEEMGVAGSIDIQMGTLSKAAGSFGAYAAGSKVLVDFLVNAARSVVFTTALPPSVAAASRAALGIIRAEPQRREKVLASAAFLREALRSLGLDVPSGTTPIIPVMLGSAERALCCSKELLESGILVSAIRPPTVPAGTARLRVTVTAAHTDQDLERCVSAFRKVISHE
ncbi:MAG: 8-amino-7-oxononanoate synthase [Candidatus Omnitrophica bacterium]|nr:8-amino-7-oxononanoate synthase [Candidatus Omnitrophota bacterium]